MTTTQRVQLEAGLIALIGPGYVAECDHGTCHEAARIGDLAHLDTCECAVDKGYLHVIIGSASDNGGVYIDGAINAVITDEAAVDLATVLIARARHIRNTPRPERGPRR